MANIKMTDIDGVVNVHVLDCTGHRTLCNMDVLPDFNPAPCEQYLGAVTCPYCKHQVDYIKSLKTQ